MKKVILNDEEYELIEAIRNFKKAYPNGHPELLYFAQRLFDEITSLE